MMNNIASERASLEEQRDLFRRSRIHLSSIVVSLSVARFYQMPSTDASFCLLFFKTAMAVLLPLESVH
jgi:hypothetical protein